MLPATKFRLGEALVQRGLITDEQLGAALAHQKLTGRRLGRALMDLKLVTDEAIGIVISEQMRIPFVNLGERDLDEALVRRLPEAQARRLRAIVLAEQDLGLQVGLVDPTDMLAYDQVCRALNTAVYPVVVTEDALLASIERIYQRHEEITGLAKEVAADMATAGIGVTTIDVAATAEDAPIVRLLQSVFDAAMSRDVSDIHIEPQEGQLIIRFRIDGSMQVQSTSSSKITSAVVQRLKLMASLDISERRLPQDGRFQIKVNNAMIDVRISTMPTQYGESVVMRLLAQNNDRIRLDAIGMPAPILKRLRAAISSASGMVLVTGPTGSGKTTTLYAALAEINSVSRKIITVEDPIEYRLPGLNQVQVNEKVGLSFARVLRACLRQDPDVILVGEMRDQETAEIGLRAALTGHLVLSTLHTLDAAGTPMRLRDMGLAPYMIALGVRLVIAQRLLRTICENCKNPYTPAPHEEAWLRLEDHPSNHGPFFQGVGCGQCNNSGHKGRAGVYELMEMTPELVQLANKDDPAGFAEAAHAAFHEFTLRRHALELAGQGITTIAEAMQASNQF